MHIEDFEDFHAEEDMHVVISVKDFKAIVTHAEILKASLSAHYSRPSRPLQFSYQAHGMLCEFTLMTSGDYQGVSTQSTAPRIVSTRATSRQTSRAPSQAMNTKPTEMAPPARPPSKSLLGQRRTLSDMSQQQHSAPTQASPESESLFMPLGDDEERHWDPPDYDKEDGEEVLGWDASADNVSALFEKSCPPTLTSFAESEHLSHTA